MWISSSSTQGSSEFAYSCSTLKITLLAGSFIGPLSPQNQETFTGNLREKPKGILGVGGGATQERVDEEFKQKGDS